MSTLVAPVTIQQFPCDLKGHGTNLYAEPLWRVVWGESRYFLAAGADGHFQWFPLYGVPFWVLERWKSPEEWAGPRDQWLMQEQMGVKLGPYPDRGEYDCSFIFQDNGKPYEPTRGAIESVIRMVEAGRSISFMEKRAALRADIDRKREAQLQRGIDIYNDAQGPFRHNPVSGLPGKKKPEDIKFTHAAEDLNMPVGDSKFFTPKKDS
jgi:hypothetical protein